MALTRRGFLSGLVATALVAPEGLSAQTVDSKSAGIVQKTCQGATNIVDRPPSSDEIDTYYAAILQATPEDTAYNFSTLIARLEGKNRTDFIGLLIRRGVCPSNLKLSGVRSAPGALGRFSVGGEPFFLSFIEGGDGMRIVAPLGHYASMDDLVRAFLIRNP